ncbi:hypothetical protein ILYODFUR_024642 [Ilyodon furcidens]|uniref:Uncharacterized protein n=1 Tax=Ilyodon furcidens TaxID=33524 RepID=A0ABV0UIS6_9TELE
MTSVGTEDYFWNVTGGMAAAHSSELTSWMRSTQHDLPPRSCDLQRPSQSVIKLLCVSCRVKACYRGHSFIKVTYSV